MQLITQAFLQLLLELYKLTGSLGWSIVGFTLLIRLLLLPLSVPAMRLQKRMQEINPELNVLKKKHKDDKKALQMAQIELYKKYNINPLAGCLPQVVQIFFLILLYQVLTEFLGTREIDGVVINTQFFWLDLSKPDLLYALPIVAGLTQLVLSVMIVPGGEVADVVPNQSKKKEIKAANKKEEETADMASMMQKQMLFMMPVMTGVAAANFPSGLGLYWVVTTVFSIVQQYFSTGWGGITLYGKRLQKYVTQH